MVVENWKAIRLVVLDVDGVLTDGGMYYGPTGEELKKFNTRDGMGVSMLQSAGITIALITGETSEMVRQRARKLQIAEVHLGVKNKREAIIGIAERLRVSLDAVCFMGDDVNDLEALKSVGLACCPNDAVDEVKKVAHYVARRAGGQGAVREVCDLLLDRS